MTHQKKPFEYRRLDETIEQLSQIQDVARLMETPAARLVDDLQCTHRAEAEADAQSLTSVYTRLQAHKRGPQESTHPSGRVLSFPPPDGEHKGSRFMNTTKTIPAGPSLEKAPAASRPASKPSLRSRLATIAAILVAGVLLASAFWAFALFHAQKTPTRQNTLTGATTPKTTAAIMHDATLRCSVTASSPLGILFGQNPVDWSSKGVLAASFPFQKTYSAQNCHPAGISWGAQLATPIWSPDGSRMLLLRGDIPQVLDARTGQVLVNFQLSPRQGFSQAVWSADGTRIFSLDETVQDHYSSSGKVQIWNANTGALVRTALPAQSFLIGSAWISPNGTYFARQGSDHRITFWNIETGKLVSTTASVAGNSQPVAWSPDGSTLAIGLPNAHWPALASTVQVWSSATGQLITAFTDKNTFEGTIGGLAWSPDGRYLAESSLEIHIWDVKNHRQVFTFGHIASKDASITYINTLVWAPDSRGMASITIHILNNLGQKDTLNVWQFA